MAGPYAFPGDDPTRADVTQTLYTRPFVFEAFPSRATRRPIGILKGKTYTELGKHPVESTAWSTLGRFDGGFTQQAPTATTNEMPGRLPPTGYFTFTVIRTKMYRAT